MYKRNVLMQMEHGAHFVNTADSEAEGTSFNAGTVHVVTDEQDELDIASDMRSRLASHDS